MSKPFNMRDMMEKMKLVNEPGLGNPKAIKEARESNLTTLLSGEKNSFINARRAYAKMTGEDLDQRKVVQKLQEQAELTEKDNLKIAGAMQVVKELVESVQIDKTNAIELYKKVRQICNSI